MEALKLLKILEAAYPKQQLPEDSVKLYVKYLEELDYADVQPIVRRHIETSKWFPAISELMNADSMAVDKPAVAWKQQRPAIGRGGWSFLEEGH